MRLDIALAQTSVGYLPEAASTNLVLQSSNFGTTWAAVGTPTRSAAVVTDTSGTVPTVTTIYEGLTIASTVSAAQSPIKNLRIAQTALTDAELVAITG